MQQEGCRRRRHLVGYNNIMPVEDIPITLSSAFNFTHSSDDIVAVVDITGTQKNDARPRPRPHPFFDDPVLSVFTCSGVTWILMDPCCPCRSSQGHHAEGVHGTWRFSRHKPWTRYIFFHRGMGSVYGYLAFLSADARLSRWAGVIRL